MLLSEAIRIRTKKLMKLHNIDNIHELSLKAGVSYNTLNDFFSSKVLLIRLNNLLHICEAFDMQLKDFFDDTVFEDVYFD